VAGVFLVFAALVRSAWQAGLNPDQIIDQQYFINNLAGIIGPERFGQYFFVRGSPELQASYGYTFQGLAFGVSWAWSALTGQFFESSSTGVIATRNVLVLLVGLTVLPSVYLIARSLSGKRWLGWTSVGAVALLPSFTGHLLINQKDIPLTAGFTAVTAAAVVFLRRVLNPDDMTQPTRRRVLRLDRDQWGLAGLLAFGICMTIGTRPPSAVAVGLTLVVAGVIALVQRRQLHRSDLLWPIIGLGVGGVIVLATNAAATPNPIAWILNSISIAGDFPGWRGQQLVNGEYQLPERLARTHIIGMVLVQTPIVFLLLGAVGVLGIIRDALTPGPIRRTTLLWAPVAIQLALLPAAGIMQESLFYNASRQVLFVYPMIAVLAAWGVFTLATWLPAGSTRIAAFVVVGVLAAVPAVDTLTLYPYQYVYFNELARGDLSTRYDLDYWGISGKEVQQWVNVNYPNAIEQYPEGWEFERYATPGITFVKDLPDASDRPLVWAANWYPAWALGDYPECPIVHEVTRSLWGENLRLGYVRLCNPQR
jgi:hypothetical protein